MGARGCRCAWKACWWLVGRLFGACSEAGAGISASDRGGGGCWGRRRGTGGAGHVAKGGCVDQGRVQGSAFVPGGPVQSLFVTCSLLVQRGLASLVSGAFGPVCNPGRWVAGKLAWGRGGGRFTPGCSACWRPVGDLLASCWWFHGSMSFRRVIRFSSRPIWSRVPFGRTACHRF